MFQNWNLGDVTDPLCDCQQGFEPALATLVKRYPNDRMSLLESEQDGTISAYYSLKGPAFQTDLNANRERRLAPSLQRPLLLRRRPNAHDAPEAHGFRRSANPVDLAQQPNHERTRLAKRVPSRDVASAARRTTRPPRPASRSRGGLFSAPASARKHHIPRDRAEAGASRPDRAEAGWPVVPRRTTGRPAQPPRPGTPAPGPRQGPGRANTKSPKINEDLRARLRRIIWRRPTLEGPCGPTTIGAGGLNCRVRDGNGWNPAAMIARNLIRSRRRA